MRKLALILLGLYSVLWFPAFVFTIFVVGMSEGKVLDIHRLSSGMWDDFGNLSVPFAAWAVLVFNPLFILALGYFVARLFLKGK
ncbi:MAG: hypothetical protein ACJ8DZ_05230 [Allosphingosinicella sp.]